MPIPVEVFVPGFRRTKTHRFHLKTDCKMLSALKLAELKLIESQISMREVSGKTTCSDCCGDLQEVAAAYQLLSAGEVGWGLGANEPVILEVHREHLPLPLGIDMFLNKAQAHKGLVDAPMNISFRVVPAWVAQWANMYSTQVLVSYNRYRFRPHLVGVPNLSEQHAEYFSLMMHAEYHKDLHGADSFQQVLPVAKSHLRLGLDVCLMAAQLWNESLRSGGPLETFFDAAEAVKLLTA